MRTEDVAFWINCQTYTYIWNAPDETTRNRIIGRNVQCFGYLVGL